MDAKQIREFHDKYLFPCVANFYEESLPLVRGKGTSLWDADGKEFLDFFGGILTVSLGHCDDEVNGKIKEQVDTLQHQLAGEALVGVQDENPVPRGVLGGEVPGSSEIVIPGLLQDARAQLPGDGHGLILAARVDEDDLVTPQK